MYHDSVRHTKNPTNAAARPGAGVVGVGPRQAVRRPLGARGTSTLDVAPGTVLGLLGHNGAGQDDRDPHPHHALGADRGLGTRRRLSTSSTDPTRVRERIGVAEQQASVDGLLSARKNLVMVGRLQHLSKRHAEQRADELLERFDLDRRRVATGQDLLGWHAPPARPRREPRGRADGAVPRRADHRASTRAAAAICGRCCATSCATAPRSCSRRSTSKRPTSSPTRSSSSTTAAPSRRAAPTN